MFLISRETLTLFGFPIQWYGVLIAFGVFLGIWVATRREKRLDLPKDTTIDLALILVPAAIVGARLYYVAFSWDYYSQNLDKIFSIREGGMAIYGSVLAGLFGSYIYARAKRLAYAKVLDLCAPSVALGQAIGRWGNFLNQEAFGAAVTNPKLQFFPFAVYIEADASFHLATFFYESAWCFFVFALLLWYERKQKLRRAGDIFLSYAFLYALERVVVEGLRTDSLYWGVFRVSQALSLCIVLAVAVMFSLHKRRPLMLLPPIFLAIALALKAQTLVTLALAVFTFVIYLIEIPERKATA